ncbi:e3 UFM1-protein ligase 1 [Caerostris darwini]|uniref:E3 UFM1-protein ligase 1 homolog n=1 Tax=Caerostris darwini TaxID=1538125 RepID=A0AAV4SYX6_9ARAC|nr:e3 UFM1-protein ligase 1 [Caerostris darwini]
MSADWEEVKRLAADFQRAQLSSTIQRLSERNCIEIVKKLIESKLIEVIFTTDGKEYLTPGRLLKEIRDELYVHGGRINLVDLAQIIGVDFNHVESKANEFLNSEPNTCMVLGQLITTDYLDHIAEEINEKLHQLGEITVAEITKLYDLPGDFLEQALHERLGTIIQGQVDSNDSRTFFTDSYVAQHTAKIRGALSALTRPIPLSSIINHFKFPEKLFYRVAEDLIKEGRLAGSISGGRSERAIFIPDIYAASQSEWIRAFYKQNNYLEYDAVGRLGILDPKAYLKKMFKDEGLVFLSSCCVGKSIINQIEATIEETLNCGTWVDILPLLPSIFIPEDFHGVIAAATKSFVKQGSAIHVYCDSILVSNELITTCEKNFEPIMETKAKEDIVKSPHLFNVQTTVRASSTKKETPKGKQDKKEDKKKKSSGGKSGGGTQGRETKTKNVKKKYFTGKEAEDAEYEEESSVKAANLELEFLNEDEVLHHLKKMESLKDAPEDLVSVLVDELHRPLTKRYREVAKTLYDTSIAASGPLDENSTLIIKKNSLLFWVTSLHLRKLQNYSRMINADSDASLTPEQRQKFINKFPEEIQKPLSKLHSSLNAKTLDDFHSAIDVAFGAGICDMIIRRPDKKRERQILANHRQSLLAQLSEAQDPALGLHLAALLIFQSHTHTMLHASGKFVPHIIGYLQKQLPHEIYLLLATYQESVIKKLTPNENEEEKRANETFLLENLPKIKETAITYRKGSISESEN